MNLMFSCFKDAWKIHSQRHVCSIQIDSAKNLSANFVVDEYKETVEAFPINTSAMDWTQICSEKEYTPTELDVGCRLKIEVTAYSAADNSVLAGPVVIYTEPVLSTPTPPPKRRLIAIPGAVTGVAGATRFRIISYNILAELYATKQVISNFIRILPQTVKQNVLDRLIRIAIHGVLHGRIERR